MNVPTRSRNRLVLGLALAALPASIGSVFEPSPGRTSAVAAAGPQQSSTATLAWSTYVGGSSADQGAVLTTDGNGNAYLVFSTTSSDLPTTPNAFQRQRAGGTDLYIAEYDPNGKQVYGSYFGGGFEDTGGGWVDPNGLLLLYGNTLSPDLPVAGAGAGHSGPKGGHDGFVAKLDIVSGRLIYGTYLGGSGEEMLMTAAPAVDGGVVAVGYTASFDFPLHQALQTTRAGNRDGFVTRLTWNGARLRLTYSTLMGGNETGPDEWVHGVRLAADGSALVGGTTCAGDFPVQAALYTYHGNCDGFLARLAPEGKLVWSTYVGGGAYETNAVPLSTGEGDGSVAFNATTFSSDMPLVKPFQSQPRGRGDSYAGRLTWDGKALRQTMGTYYGGGQSDIAGGRWRPDGAIFLVGGTSSLDLPLAKPIQDHHAGLGACPEGSPDWCRGDAFVAELAADGKLAFATYLGGSGYDAANTSAIGPGRALYVAGETASVDFPTTLGAPRSALGLGSELFLARIDLPERDEVVPTATSIVIPTVTPADEATPTPPPTRKPTERPSATPTATRVQATPTTVPVTDAPTVPPTNGVSVCPLLARHVPAAAIHAAMANPGKVRGWGMRCNINVPPSPGNVLRSNLSLQNFQLRYDRVANPLVFKCGCP